MGNWRTVNIKGKVNPDEARQMIKCLTDIKYGWENKLYCLAIHQSLCGLNQWVKTNGEIDAIGNLSKRDYDNDDIEIALKELAKRYPSLELTLHSGDDYEGLDCTATFHVSHGKVSRCEPEIEKIEDISVEQMRKNF